MFISEIDIKISYCSQVLDNSDLRRNKNSEIFLHVMPFFFASFTCIQQHHWLFVDIFVQCQMGPSNLGDTQGHTGSGSEHAD